MQNLAHQVVQRPLVMVGLGFQQSMHFRVNFDRRQVYQVEGHRRRASSNSRVRFDRRKNIRPDHLEVHQPGVRDFSGFASFRMRPVPLGNSLRGDLTKLSHFAGATQGGDDFLGVHDELKHSYNNKARDLFGRKFSLMTYGERLNHAIKLEGSSRRLLARAVGITEQAVGQCIRGDTEFLKVPGSVKAAEFLKVDHTWLATGKGEPR